MRGQLGQLGLQHAYKEGGWGGEEREEGGGGREGRRERVRGQLGQLGLQHAYRGERAVRSIAADARLPLWTNTSKARAWRDRWPALEVRGGHPRGLTEGLPFPSLLALHRSERIDPILTDPPLTAMRNVAASHCSVG